jgi:hypothetical protein
MRKALSKREGERKKFRAIFDRFGSKSNYHGYKEETVLLKNVVEIESNEIVTDHIWFSYTKGFQDAGLSEGVFVEFEARVKVYAKGYVNRKYGINKRASDYKLSHPSKINVVKVM